MSLRKFFYEDEVMPLLKEVTIPMMDAGVALDMPHLHSTLKEINIENSKIDVVFVPLLCFDKQGHRVGYGKGFYDNFLHDCNTETIKIGLSLFEAEDHIQDIHENDIALDYCITPKKIYQFH